MAAIRPAAVAGMFYPGDRRVLAAEVDDLLGAVEAPGPRLGFPKALIVPHAGYVYSGAIAAQAYDELAPARGIVRRVVVLGPCHRVAVRGLAVPTTDAFDSPLGPVPVDRDALAAVRDLPQVSANDAAHELEHSIEVQLPFLQRQLGDFTLAPFAVGMAGAQEVSQVLERLWGGSETLIVISTDMSHYHSYAQARRVDAHTVARIAACDTDIDHDEACGATPLNGLLSLVRDRKLPIKLLAACNSGDTAGSRERVVGYSAFALYEPHAVASVEEAGAALVEIACRAIERELFLESSKPFQAPWLKQLGATFVTLKKGGELRGCIGSLQATRPLADDVAHNALVAAFRDPRFPALTAGEWPQCRVEVSLLSTPKPVRFADEDELFARIRPGEDGVILEAEGRRGTFLPQVWESIPEVRSFFNELIIKVGLPPDTRLARCNISRYRVVKFDGR